MTPENFVYWLQGFFELTENDTQQLDERKVQIIRDHLQLVFDKKTPDRKVVTIIDTPTIDDDIDAIRKMLNRQKEDFTSPKPYTFLEAPIHATVTC